MWPSTGLGVNRLGGSLLGAAIAAIFAAGEPGAVFIAQKPSEWGGNANLVTMYQDDLGTTPLTALEQTVGLQLDVRPIFGKPVGPNTVGTPLYAADSKSTGAVGLIGAATAATYVTATGVGAATRVDAADQSYVAWPGVAQTFQRMTIQNTGATSLTVYRGTPAGTAITTVAGGATKTLTLALGASTSLSVAPTADATAITFTVSALQLSYGNHRSQSSAGARARLSARYNKVTFPNANPTATTGLSFVNATNGLGVLSIANDAAALATAGLSGVCALGNVVKIDNSLGDTGCALAFPGTAGNTNTQLASVYSRSTGSGVRVQADSGGAGSSAFTPSTGYVRLSATLNAVSGTKVGVAIPAGVVAFIILPDMRESCYSYLPTPQIILGTGATAADYDDKGFPARLVYSGAQGYATPSVDFSGAGTAQVWWAGAKLSDAAAACLVELSANWFVTDGTFQTTAPGSAGANFGAGLRGTASGFGSFVTFTAPVMSVLTNLYDTAGASQAAAIIGRVNGVVQTLNSPGGVAPSGGNLRNDTLNFFARGTSGSGAGTQNFTGDEFISIVRGGATPSAANIARVERFAGRRALLSF